MDGQDHLIEDIERTRQIRRVLSFYDCDFTKYLASTISFAEKLPEEINNQIRNAFTHLARAQEAQNLTDFNREIELAISHIERANRDCLKASIIIARDQLESLVSDAVFYYVALTPDLKARHKNIVDLRRQAYQAETRGDKNQVARLEEILRETMHTADLVREQYREVGSRKAKALRFLHRWSNPLATVAALLLGYIIHPFLRPLQDAALESLKLWLASQ